MSVSARAIRHHRWKRRQYEAMVEVGVFEPGDRLELIDGYVVDMTPQSSRHATAVKLVEEALRATFGKDHLVRTQMPFALDEDSEPEPDVAVVPGEIRDYVDSHPANTAILVEVAHATLSLDRGLKAKLYARAGVPEYWVVNLVEATLEVHRDPSNQGYSTRTVLNRAGTIRPLARPERSIQVADLLP